MPAVEWYSKKVIAGSLAQESEKEKMMEKRLPYERLTVDILLVRGEIGGLAVPGQTTEGDSTLGYLAESGESESTALGHP